MSLSLKFHKDPSWIGRDIEANQNGSFETLGSHPKLQIDKLGLLVCSTGAWILSLIKIQVDLAEI